MFWKTKRASSQLWTGSRLARKSEPFSCRRCILQNHQAANITAPMKKGSHEIRNVVSFRRMRSSWKAATATHSTAKEVRSIMASVSSNRLKYRVQRFESRTCRT